MHTASHELSVLSVRREGLQWSKETTASATAVLDTYGKHVGELDHLIQPVALRVQVSTCKVFCTSCCPYTLCIVRNGCQVNRCVR